MYSVLLAMAIGSNPVAGPVYPTVYQGPKQGCSAALAAYPVVGATYGCAGGVAAMSYQTYAANGCAGGVGRSGILARHNERVAGRAAARSARHASVAQARSSVHVSAAPVTVVQAVPVHAVVAVQASCLPQTTVRVVQRQRVVVPVIRSNPFGSPSCPNGNCPNARRW